MAFIDFNGDGFLDIAVGAGQGLRSRVKIFDGRPLIGQLLGSVTPPPPEVLADYFADNLADATLLQNRGLDALQFILVQNDIFALRSQVHVGAFNQVS